MIKSSIEYLKKNVHGYILKLVSIFIILSFTQYNFIEINDFSLLSNVICSESLFCITSKIVPSLTLFHNFIENYKEIPKISPVLCVPFVYIMFFWYLLTIWNMYRCLILKLLVFAFSFVSDYPLLLLHFVTFFFWFTFL